jgi:hypothetical protein
MKSTIEVGLFTGYSIVSHLQFLDDTILLGVKSWENVRFLKVVLLLFEAISGPKVNFNKSMLVGVNIAASWLVEVASVFNCKSGSYLSFIFGFLLVVIPVG